MENGGYDLGRLRRMCGYGRFAALAAAVLMALLLVLFVILTVAGSVSDDVRDDMEMAEFVLTALVLDITSALAAYALFQLYLVLRSIGAERTPFTAVNARRVRLMATSVVVAGVADVVLGVAMAAGGYDGGSFLAGIALILAGLIIYALALVFGYGAVLQTESDETLRPWPSYCVWTG